MEGNMGLQPLQQATYQCIEGPTLKYAVSPSSTPITDYIIATQHICDSFGENNPFGKTDCTEYYAKVKYVLTKLTAKPKFSNITKEEKKAYSILKKMTAIRFLLQTKEFPWSL